MSLLDIDDPISINTVNLLENGWTYVPADEHWIKTTSLSIGVKHPHFIYKEGKVMLRGWYSWGVLSHYVDTIEELEDWVYCKHEEITHSSIFSDDIFDLLY